MNDRFKCRLWDKNNKVMHYEAEYITSGDSGNDWIIFKSDKQKLEENDIFKQPYFRQQFIIMQCTGLKDKNGKLIYEGDIVRYSEYDIEDIEPEWEYDEIIWGDKYSYPAFDFKNGNLFDCNGLSYIFNEGWTIEVIGNIYENKELLEREG